MRLLRLRLQLQVLVVVVRFRLNAVRYQVNESLIASGPTAQGARAGPIPGRPETEPARHRAAGPR